MFPRLGVEQQVRKRKRSRKPKARSRLDTLLSLLQMHQVYFRDENGSRAVVHLYLRPMGTGLHVQIHMLGRLCRVSRAVMSQLFVHVGIMHTPALDCERAISSHQTQASV